MGRRIMVGALVVALAAVLGGAAPAGAARNRVKIVDFSYQPKRIEIAQGTRVLWVNQDDAPHTVTAVNGKFDSGEIAPGETYSRRFPQTGVFRYFCEIHPEMRGKVLPVDV